MYLSDLTASSPPIVHWALSTGISLYLIEHVKHPPCSGSLLVEIVTVLTSSFSLRFYSNVTQLVWLFASPYINSTNPTLSHVIYFSLKYWSLLETLYIHLFCFFCCLCISSTINISRAGTFYRVPETESATQ